MNEPNIPPPGILAIRDALRDMPSSAGVYRMLDESGAVLYVGKAKHLKNRVGSYVNVTQLPLRLQRMVHATRRVEITLTDSEAEALLLEANLVKSQRPHFNIMLKDDKSFPYIHLSGDHAYPRLSKYRGAKDIPGTFFGPFVSALAVNETLTYLQRAFLLRPCTDAIFRSRTRPCLQYQIKRCSAPCVNYITVEDYGKLITQAKRFLSGESREIQQQLIAEMQASAEATDYETAATLRDRLRALSHIQQQAARAGGLDEGDVVALCRDKHLACIQVFSYRGGANYGNNAFFPSQTEEAGEDEIMAAFLIQYYQRTPPPRQLVLSHEPLNAEVVGEALSLLAKRRVEVGVPQRGDKKVLVEQALRNAREALQRRILENMRQHSLLEGVCGLFNLKEPPSRIEVYDNSHISGTNAVGAMVVAGPDGFHKKAYRIFNIKSTTLAPGDDYAMLREVLTRRFSRLLAEEGEDGSEGTRPDLVLIDGGAGQLSVAQQVFAELGISDIPFAAIAKGPERNAGREWFHLPGREPFQLPTNDAILHYLQRLRDEAHRFAIGAHRNRRSKAVRTSELDSIPGIGAARKKALLQHFGSSREVAGASIADLEHIPGINRETAKKIYDHFHG